MSEEEIRVLKKASCSSLSNRSTLTFEIGCKEDKSIHLRLTDNDGAGMFSKDWVPFEKIDLLLSADQITSNTIRPLYSGSTNSAGFLLAVLKDVGLIKNIDENSRGYIRIDPQKFTSEIHALMDADPPKKKGKKSDQEASQ